MRSSKGICAILIAIIIVILYSPSFAQEKEKPWTGTLRDGTKINEKDLKQILSDHLKWINDKKEGKKADLSEANLQGANFESANLQGAWLSCALAWLDADIIAVQEILSLCWV